MKDIIKIKIITPAKVDGKWGVACSRGILMPTRKKTAVSAYRFIERKLQRFLGTSDEGTIGVWVQYGMDMGHNDGQYQDRNYTMYVLLCFLEDYLPKGFISNRTKKYYPEAFMEEGDDK